MKAECIACRQQVWYVYKDSWLNCQKEESNACSESIINVYQTASFADYNCASDNNCNSITYNLYNASTLESSNDHSVREILLSKLESRSYYVFHA